MYISQRYSRTGISPSDLPSSEFSTRESSLALSECLPVDLLRDAWTWRDLFSGAPILTTLEARIQSLSLLQAQKARDLNRSLRSDPSKWEDATIGFASKVLLVRRTPAVTMQNFSMNGTEP